MRGSESHPPPGRRPGNGGAGGRDVLAGIVVRGRDIATLDAVVARLLGAVTGRAVVCARLSAPTPVSPAVIHAAVDALSDSGADEVIVGSALRVRDRDRGHSSIEALARRAGLSGRTDRGRQYQIVDLADDLVTAPVPSTSVLDGRPISRLWATADVRVVVGRAMTDLLQAYAGGLDALAGACPDIPGAETADVVSALVQHLAPALAVVDAIVTSDGPDGARLPHPTRTDAVIVTSDALLADCALAGLLGEDRSASPLVERALADLGAPVGRVDGDLTPFTGVTRPQLLARHAVRRAACRVRIGRVLAAAIGGPDEAADTGDPVLSALRSVVTPAVVAAADPVGQAGLVSLLAAATAAADTYHAWAAGFAKDKVELRVVPLGFDPGAVPVESYEDLPEFFAPFDAIIDALPTGVTDAMRWTTVDGATVFECSREIAADFDDFVARVDVAEGIGLMADYLGGRRVAVGGHGPRPAREGAVRTRQAERNLYLPQPNYLAAWGGRPIDVCKIELVEKGPDSHRLWWRTISSPNGSATYDDGTLTFTRTAGGVRATVRGRQLFTLPPLLTAVDLAQLPELHDPLLEDAYRRFFTTTFDNLEACFEGREFRIGRQAPDADEPLATAMIQLLLDAAAGWIKERIAPGGARADGPGTPAGTWRGVRPDAQTGEVDAHGFRHFRGAR